MSLVSILSLKLKLSNELLQIENRGGICANFFPNNEDTINRI